MKKEIYKIIEELELGRISLLKECFGDQEIAFEAELEKRIDIDLLQMIYEVLNKIRLYGGSIFFNISELAQNFDEVLKSEVQKKQVTKSDRALINYHSINVYTSTRLPLLRVSSFFLGLFLLQPLIVLILLLYTVTTNPVIYNAADAQVITYDVTQDSEFKLRLSNTAGTVQDYSLIISTLQNGFDFADSQTDAILQIEPEKYILGELSKQFPQQVYRFDIFPTTTQTIEVDALFFNAEEVNFTLLDNQGNICVTQNDTLTYYGPSLRMSCEIQTEGPYFLQVNAPLPNVNLLTPKYAFIVHVARNEIEPNDTPDEAVLILEKENVKGQLGIREEDWYKFNAPSGSKIRIVVGDPDVKFELMAKDGASVLAMSHPGFPTFLDNDNIKVNGYKSFEKFPAFIQLSNQINKASGTTKFLETTLAKYAFSILMVIILILALITLLALILPLFVSSASLNASEIVGGLLSILQYLKNESILRSEKTKLELQSVVNSTADQIAQLYQNSPWWVRTPQLAETKDHFARIAHLIRQTSYDIAATQPDTMEKLRKKYLEWLLLFVRGDYGSFEFPETFETSFKNKPVIKQSYLQENWKNMLYFSIFFGGIYLTLSTAPNLFWPSQQFNGISTVLLIIRYLFLVIFVYAAFMQWGQPIHVADQAVARWETVMRFILFFIVPFIVFDGLLNTNIIDTLIKFVSSIKF